MRIYLFCSNLEMMYHLKTLFERKGSPAKFWLGSKLLIFINDPAQCEQVLENTNSMDKGDLYKIIAHGVGYGLITLSGLFLCESM